MRRLVVPVVAAAALVACTGEGDLAVPRTSTSASTSSTGASPPDARLRVAGCEPTSLYPADADACSAPIVELLYGRLVTWGADGTPRWGDDAPDALLADVASDDGRIWRLQLRPGLVHHDGTPVTAADVERGWVDAARGPNVRRWAHLLRDVVGFDALRCDPDSECLPPDGPTGLSGVRVLDERTLQVVLTARDSQFPTRLGHVALAPLPPLASEDPEAFGEEPIGTGPMRMDGPWQHDESIRLAAVDPDAHRGIVVHLLPGNASPATAIRDGRVDLAVGPVLPDASEIPGVFESTGPGLGYTYLLMPVGADPRLGAALSLAIDRRAIIDRDLGGRARPARTPAPPHLAAVDPDACAPHCGFAPEPARELYTAVGGIPDDRLEIVTPRTPDLQGVRAVAADLERHLPGLTVEVVVVPVAEVVPRATDASPSRAVRLRWQGELPLLRNYLQPLHTPTGAFSFDSPPIPGVINELAHGDAITTRPGAREAYARALRAAAQRWRHVPLWFPDARVLRGPHVDTVPFGPAGTPDLMGVVVDAA